MIVGPMTRKMVPTKMLAALKSNRWNPSQPIDSLQMKRMKQQHRTAAELKKKDDAGEDPDIVA